MSLFIKVAGFSPETFLKKTQAQVFSCEFVKFLRKPFLKEHLRWLLRALEFSRISNTIFIEEPYSYNTNTIYLAFKRSSQREVFWIMTALKVFGIVINILKIT